MLPTRADIAVAEQLLLRLRELVTPTEPEMCRAGELPGILHCARTTSWQCTRRPDFPAPAVVLGPRLRMWRRAEVIAWRDAQKAESPRPRGPRASDGTTVLGVTSAGPTSTGQANVYATPGRGASRAARAR